ncbi:TetR/AcrR family transcriptional regulator [Microbacterium sp. zg-B185]|nr:MULTISPECIES: TetR/AcrR family transcriptional regulator [unclassified Microbacterium]MCR2809594.1 TetR/AcrR family transcriptional regulator [Microbacterium sp. zg.B185]WIM18080.1 TetR/AcrR family transcriptional regulator [Microbacterium sp. zg-B185]
MARAGLTGDRLAQAGFELVDEIGFERVTIAELARRFGVKPASLYSHLQGYDDLRTRIALLALEEIDERVSDAVAGRAGKTHSAASPTRTATLPRPTPAGSQPPSIRSIAKPPSPARAPVSHSESARFCGHTRWLRWSRCMRSG